MSYIPPYLRKRESSQIDENTKERNIFTYTSFGSQVENTPSDSNPNSEAELPPDIDAEELFPMLGKNSKVEVSSLNFASSLFNPHKKNDEIEKDIPDGWVRLQKNGEFVYGDKSEFAEEFEEFLEIME